MNIINIMLHMEMCLKHTTGIKGFRFIISRVFQVSELET